MLSFSLNGKLSIPFSASSKVTVYFCFFFVSFGFSVSSEAVFVSVPVLISGVTSVPVSSEAPVCVSAPLFSSGVTETSGSVDSAPVSVLASAANTVVPIDDGTIRIAAIASAAARLNNLFFFKIFSPFY